MTATRSERVFDECRRRGLSVYREGRALRIVGPRTDILVSDLAQVDLRELDDAAVVPSSAQLKPLRYSDRRR